MSSVPIGSKIYHIATCDDSMQWAKDHLQHAPDGAVFIADELTHARGRQGRIWQLSPGQIAVTLLLKPFIHNPDLHDNLELSLNHLNMALCLGVQEPLKHFGVRLKWPNDFVAFHKKIGGMLMELVWHDNKPAGIIAGFALNVNNTFKPTDELYERATSLRTLSHDAIDMLSLREEILVSLDHWYQRWLAQEFEEIFDIWKHEQAYLGEQIEVHQKDETIVKGLAKDVMPNGDLVIIPSGKNEEIIIPFYVVEEVKVG